MPWLSFRARTQSSMYGYFRVSDLYGMEGLLILTIHRFREIQISMISQPENIVEAIDPMISGSLISCQLVEGIP